MHLTLQDQGEMMEEQDKTVAKTLWSETLIEALLLGLQKNVSDEKIRELIGDLYAKGYKQNYIVNKVTKELDSAMAARVRRLMVK